MILERDGVAKTSVRFPHRRQLAPSTPLLPHHKTSELQTLCGLLFTFDKLFSLRQALCHERQRSPLYLHRNAQHHASSLNVAD